MWFFFWIDIWRYVDQNGWRGWPNFVVYHAFWWICNQVCYTLASRSIKASSTHTHTHTIYRYMYIHIYTYLYTHIRLPVYCVCVYIHAQCVCVWDTQYMCVCVCIYLCNHVYMSHGFTIEIVNAVFENKLKLHCNFYLFTYLFIFHLMIQLIPCLAFDCNLVSVWSLALLFHNASYIYIYTVYIYAQYICMCKNYVCMLWLQYLKTSVSIYFL